MAGGGGGSVDDLVGVVVCTDPEIVLWAVTVISGLAVHDRVVREAKPFMRHTPPLLISRTSVAFTRPALPVSIRLIQ